MVSRRVLAGVAVLVLVASAGCIGEFGVGIPEEELAEDADYEWNTSTTTEIQLYEGGLLGGSEYRAVYSGNDTVITLFTRGLTRTSAVDIRAVQFRYENGTVVGHEQIAVSQTARETTVRLPAADGQLAFTGDRRSQELHIRTFDGGSVAVVLPQGHRVGDLLLSDVQPRGYETNQTDDGRTVLAWDDVDDDRTVLVRHFRDRDWFLFYGLLAVTSVAAVLGYAYFSRQIRKIQARREQYGLDVDHEDDDGKGPPPGMG